MKRPPSQTPGAIRQRRFRERMQQGIQTVKVRVDPETIDALYDRGLLAPGEEEDPERIERALLDAAHAKCPLCPQ